MSSLLKLGDTTAITWAGGAEKRRHGKPRQSSHFPGPSRSLGRRRTWLTPSPARAVCDGSGMAYARLTAPDRCASFIASSRAVPATIRMSASCGLNRHVVSTTRTLQAAGKTHASNSQAKCWQSGAGWGLNAGADVRDVEVVCAAELRRLADDHDEGGARS